MMHFIYSQLMRILLPLMLLRLLKKAKLNPDYKKRWCERLCKSQKKLNAKKGGFVVHVASLGEAIAANAIIKALLEKYPHEAITVTCTTPTGSAQIIKSFASSVHHCYLPFDLPWLQNRFIKHLQPKVLILMETELWPNLINAAKKNHCRIFVMNARMSERSAKGYKKLAQLTNSMMKKLDVVAAQDSTDGKRFAELGCRAHRIKVTGNLKFDTHLSAVQKSQITSFGEQLKLKRPVWLAASTHPGEDEIILQAHQYLLKQQPDLLLILVPRHPERFLPVYQIAKKTFNSQQKSQLTGPLASTVQVLVGDTLGEMHLYNSLADIVFIGGSLVERGGHNPFEAACQYKAIIHGPYTFNFATSYHYLTEQNASLLVTESSLANNVAQLLQDTQARLRLATAAKSSQQKMQGATERTLQLIDNQYRIAKRMQKQPAHQQTINLTRLLRIRS
ncbi:lipid IV(A) 3-deoxy-D-manno-octulosonic acid transferase [Gayadomonas joobiniege]|uniref:lipid IV(A) 3-deoxy-D-manno-octulosonic acid transferase n=1 Tax=Gayadomonas joobiniege TaxID=1234606 RepID=UPI00035DCAC6|nr:lipid IV(A) 3-deoxy-D-manno-octulosonic acid transferase [Gayadomonas joobiniege]